MKIIQVAFVLSACALLSHHASAETTVNNGFVYPIHGVGELDLTGGLIYAINFSATTTPVVNGVTFAPDYNPPAGVTLAGANNIDFWQASPNFGSTPDGLALSEVYRGIRYALPAAGQALEAHLLVTPGETYKIQLLIYENKTGNRRWDIQVEDVLSVDEFTSLGKTTVDTSLRPYQPNVGIVFTQQLVAGDDSLDILMGDIGGNSDGGDRNPICQGLTVEHITTTAPDTDGDGLPDAWEQTNFGNLAQTFNGDEDSDALSNGLELTLGINPHHMDSDGDGLNDAVELDTLSLNPKLADTDADGLTDGAEINTHHTDPLRADTDSDGLNDGAEIMTHLTNPLVTDSDGDDYPDGVEVSNGTNPLLATSFPLLSNFVQPVTGGEAGEGLDLTGTFVYAFNVGSGTPAGLIRDADFTTQNAPGITIAANGSIENWSTPLFGDTVEDLALNTVLASIRHAGANKARITVTLTGLTAGRPYKLQVLALERCCNRGFDIYVDNVLKVDEFAPYTWQDNVTSQTMGGVAVIGFLATGTSTQIVLDGATVSTPAYTDRNPILSGITLEALTGADADGDGLLDLWETANFGNLAQGPTGDPDTDGLNNLGEFTNGTNPNLPDTDGDGLNDRAELITHLTDPRVSDTDGDGLSDGSEVNVSLTSPILKDTDGDYYADNVELAQGTNPNSAAVYPIFTTLAASFTGGDPGEGLDMTGNFLYAFNVGTPGAAPGPVGDVSFTSDAEPGITLATVNEIPLWITPEYGDSSNDDNLEFVMQSIRWTPAPGTVDLDLAGLTAGRVYKLQLFFGEGVNPTRGFDVEIEGLQRVDEFSPGSASRGAVITHTFVAGDDTLNLVLNGNGVTTLGITDHNPILNAVTLEELMLPDTDNDNLPDIWELQFFGNLAQGPNGNPDNDGVTNALELAAGTRPNAADTDQDGVDDGQESAAGTNPNAPDTDRDGLGDGQEILVTHTNPLAADTDGDGFIDSVELLGGFDPNQPASVPMPTVGTFTGGDVGEGLDLDGTFLYAFNVGTNGAGGLARDANITSDSAPGITVSAANQIPNWHNPNYGDTANDDVIEKVMQSMRWMPAPGIVGVDLQGIEPGKRYKLQLLFAETGTARGFDVNIEGATFVNDFFPGQVQGATNTQGAVVTLEYIARDTVLNLVLNGNTTSAGDKNPILSAVTLELVPPGVPFTLQVVSITQAGVSFAVTGAPGKTYALDYSPNLQSSTWSEENDAVTLNASGVGTVTDISAGHRSGATGFWRLRDPLLKPAP